MNPVRCSPQSPWLQITDLVRSADAPEWSEQQATAIKKELLSALKIAVRELKVTAGVAWTIILKGACQDLNAVKEKALLDTARSLLHNSGADPAPQVSDKSPQVQYYDLPYNGAAIRLLVLLPASHVEEPVKCRLAYESLDTKLKFEGLSYVWGNSTETRDIFVDGQPMAVTTNLWSALRHLRLKDKPRILWVDAICINQSDILEKNRQVRLMGRIYGEAERVVIWLGPESDTTALAWQFLRGAGNVPVPSNGGEAGLEEVLSAIRPYLQYMASSHPQHVSAFQKLCTRPWFSRTWTVQEATLAKVKMIQCGKYTASLDILGICLREGAVCLFQLGLGLDAIKWLKAIALLQGVMAPMTIERALECVRILDCSDPRDKIYSILDIERAGPSPWHLTLLPDYTLSTEQVYIAAARDIIVQSKSLEILIQAQGVYTDQSRTLPSWVPDWRPSKSFRAPAVGTGSKMTMSERTIDEKRIRRFHAGVYRSTEQDSMLAPQPEFLLDGRALAVRTIMFDSLQVEGPNIEFTTDGKRQQSILDAIDWCRQVYANQEPSIEMIERLLKHAIGFFAPRDMSNIDSEFEVVDGSHSTQDTYLWKLCRTSRGLLMLGPPSVRTDDTIVVFPTASVPFVLRQPVPGLFTLLGRCYVSEIMFGEVFEEPLMSTCQVERIVIV